MVTTDQLADLARQWARAARHLDKVGMDVELDEATPADERVAAVAQAAPRPGGH